MAHTASSDRGYRLAGLDISTTHMENATRQAAGLPLPSLRRLPVDHHRMGPYIAVSTVSPRGRLAIAGAVRHLEWTPGQQLSLSIHDDCIEIRTPGDNEVVLRIDRSLHLYLPASLRHAAGIRSGDTLLVAALTPPRLRIYPSAKLEALLALSAEHDRAQK